MNAQFPGVAEGFDLLGFTANVGFCTILDIALAQAALPVGAELDAIGRVDVDHLDLPAQVLALGE